MATAINLDEIIRKNQKGVEAARRKFDLIPLTWQGNQAYSFLGEPNNTSEFYADGEAGFAIRTQGEDGNPVVVCAVTFYNRPLRHHNGIVDDDPRHYPRVVQMQGCTMPGDGRVRRGIVMHSLSTFSLEDVCMDIAIDQAYRQRAPAVGILPASANSNTRREGFKMDKAFVRYDGTAKKRGFTKNENGLFVLELNTP